jgi:hypothetical protein
MPASLPVATAQESAFSNLSRRELEQLVSEKVRTLSEDEALAVLDSPYAGPEVCGTIARNQRLTGFYSIRLRLVGHRQTPQAHSVKLVHYLYWFDLLRLSTDVLVPAPVRRAIDTQLLLRVSKLALGQKVSSARLCGPALIPVLLSDPHPRVFEALLVNKRLSEEHLLAAAASPDMTPEKLQVLAADSRWSWRRSIRLALVNHPATPRSIAATQLRHLSRTDLRRIHSRPQTSVYLRRCIERLLENAER